VPKLPKIFSTQLGKGTFWNLAGAAIPLLVGLFTIPTLVRGMGQEAFGLLTLLWTTIGYFSLFDFGLGRAITHYLAGLRAQAAAIPQSVLRTAALSTLLPGMLGAILLHLLAEPLASRWLNISPALVPEAVAAFQLAGWSIPLVTLSSGLRGMLEGYEDFRASAILRMSLGILNFAAPFVLVELGHTDLQMIVWALLLSRLASIGHNLYLLRRQAWRADGAWVNRTVLRRLFGFGSWMSVSNVLGPLMINFDRYAVAALLSAEVVAYYTVPQDLVLRLLLVPIALTTAMFPRMTLLFSGDNRFEANKLYRRARLWVGFTMGSGLLLLALLAKPALSWWLGVDFAAASWQLSQVLLIGIFFNSLALLPFTAIQARGGVKITSLLHLCELLLYLPALYLSLQTWGLLGAAWVWTSRTALDFVLLQLLYNRN
jgi:O-antigen/teichoic acid export membrane protein